MPTPSRKPAKSAAKKPAKSAAKKKKKVAQRKPTTRTSQRVSQTVKVLVHGSNPASNPPPPSFEKVYHTYESTFVNGGMGAAPVGVKEPSYVPMTTGASLGETLPHRPVARSRDNSERSLVEVASTGTQLDDSLSSLIELGDAKRIDAMATRSNLLDYAIASGRRPASKIRKGELIEMLISKQ